MLDRGGPVFASGKLVPLRPVRDGLYSVQVYILHTAAEGNRTAFFKCI